MAVAHGDRRAGHFELHCAAKAAALVNRFIDHRAPPDVSYAVRASQPVRTHIAPFA